MSTSPLTETPAKSPLPPDPKWEREYLAYQRLLPSLLAEYDGQVVAIHEGKVIASGENESAVLLEAFAKAGHVAMHVERVSAAVRPPSRIRSPRTVRAPLE